jgi:fatty-acid desaturase
MMIVQDTFSDKSEARETAIAERVLMGWGFHNHHRTPQRKYSVLDDSVASILIFAQ